MDDETHPCLNRRADRLAGSSFSIREHLTFRSVGTGGLLSGISVFRRQGMVDLGWSFLNRVWAKFRFEPRRRVVSMPVRHAGSNESPEPYGKTFQQTERCPFTAVS